MKRVDIEKNRYVDSVTLMGLGARIQALPGITAAEVQMATPANCETLISLGFEMPAGAGPNDLVLALSGESDAALDHGMQQIRDLLDHKRGPDAAITYHSLDEIDLRNDPYDLVQISLPGEYAAAEARKALDLGLDVFIFSDNVPIEDELALKKLGTAKGRLVMGPDCGVGLINGVALAAGSIVRKGPVGIVGASGSGAQEVACLIEKCGSGVSSIIGTGGRDLYPQVGGLSMLQGMQRLAADPETAVIVLVSKLADRGVMERVLTAADQLEKPVVAVFLGSDASLFMNHRVQGAFSLEAAALTAIHLLTGNVPTIGFTDAEIAAITAGEIRKYRPEQRYLRGFFCGGTFTEECLIHLRQQSPDIPVFSNLKTRYATRLASPLQSEGHTILDLGSEDFTREAPHPVFDPTLRLKRFDQELQDPTVAVVLLDFITGPGVHPDPITPFAAACRGALRRRQGAITFIAAICGSLEDPQDVLAKEQLLRAAGVIVTASNYQSTRLAGALLAALEKRGEV